MKTQIIYEDLHVIVCYKPVGIAVESTSFSESDMVSELKNHIHSTTKVRAPYLGVVHRLDQPVSGVLVFAKTKEAAAALSKQIIDHKMDKIYRAKIYKTMPHESGMLEHQIYRDPRTNTSHVLIANQLPRKGIQAKKAALEYQVLQEYEAGYSEVEIRLLTGRHHQIRVQFAAIECPLLGDVKYGNVESIQLSKDLSISTVALTAYKLVFTHPVTKKKMSFESPRVYG